MIFFISRVMRWQVLRYLISGGSAGVTNLATLFVMVHFFHVWYLLSAIVAFLVAVFVSFLMQKYFTFNDYNKEKIKKQSLLYFAIQVFNLGPNTLLLYIAVDKLGIHYLLAQILVLGVIAIYTFFLFKHLVFSSSGEYNKVQ